MAEFKLAPPRKDVMLGPKFSHLKMKSNLRSWIVLGTLALATHATSAQSPPAMGGGPGWNLALNRLFGSVDAFSADTELRMLTAGGQELLRFTGIRFSFLDESVRVEIDMNGLKSTQMPPGAMESMKRMGMDQMVNVMLPQKKSFLMIYPGLEAYVEMPIPEEQYAVAPEDYTLEKSELGPDSIDGQSFQKSEVTLTDPNGKSQKVIVWTGTEPKDFPVQMQFTQGEQVIVMRHRNIELERPDPQLFQAPASYTRHTDVQALMQSAMQRMLKAAGQ
jgi:hypothetical protein